MRLAGYELVLQAPPWPRGLILNHLEIRSETIQKEHKAKNEDQRSPRHVIENETAWAAAGYFPLGAAPLSRQDHETKDVGRMSWGKPKVWTTILLASTMPTQPPDQ